MRTYKIEEVPATTRTVLAETQCDFCGKVANHGRWDHSEYSVNYTELKVTVRQKEGHSYPEGGFGTEIIVDMCPECFKDKLIPWINVNGTHKIKEKDWEW